MNAQASEAGLGFGKPDMARTGYFRIWIKSVSVPYLSKFASQTQAIKTGNFGPGSVLWG